MPCVICQFTSQFLDLLKIEDIRFGQTHNRSDYRRMATAEVLVVIGSYFYKYELGH